MDLKVSKLIGDKELIVETGKLARQADAAVTVRYGGTVVLVTAVMSSEKREELNFLPLTVEYREKTYAAGKIPGGFFKREGRPSEKEILSSRLIDRPIRALFPDGMCNDLQVMAIVLSSDEEVNPDILAVNGASFALTISDIPFEGPVACVRVGIKDEDFIVNPTYQDLEESDMDLVVAGTYDGIVMMEGSMKELSEEQLENAIEFSWQHINEILDMQEDFRQRTGKDKRMVELYSVPLELVEIIKKTSLNEIRNIRALPVKKERIEAMKSLTDRLIEELVKEESEFTSKDIKNAINKIEKEDVRDRIINENIRIDARALQEIRPIECEVGMLPKTHGSGLFTRGETQSLAVTTLGTVSDAQMIDALEGEYYKKFMLHYNFPPFSVGEVKPPRGPGRREIGHGILAEKALEAVMPDEEEFPYTVRVVSDILESNGSSSMASICGSSLSLMDAGVPINRAVAGIALGLVKHDEEFRILTDIRGIEDAYGDMDFKVAGTDKGITAVQLDVKIKGITRDILVQAFSQARKAREFILGKMNKVIDRPRESLSPFAPRIIQMGIDIDKIGSVIGPGGRTIKSIIEKTGACIDINDLEGEVVIAAPDEEKALQARDMISRLIEDVEVGKVYTGRVTRVTNFGAFCEILPGKEGLIHISELSDKYTQNVKDVVQAGDMVNVKVIKIDDMGRVNLSLKQVES